MEKRIKIFRDDNWLNLEAMTNIFLKNTNGKLHEIILHNYEHWMLAMLVYTPEIEEIPPIKSETHESRIIPLRG